MWQDKLKEVIYILENSDVNEIDVTFWGRRFRVVKSAGVNVNSGPTPAVTITAASGASSVPEAAPTESAPETASSGEKILSPMPGTFYAASSPDTPPFVKKGDTVSEGDALCIIEAMKIMNEIESEQSGTIVEVLVENGNPVEYNQPLFVIEPS
ncbi:MAG: acetyl-CoA carboxylase biotin carboxyl carrier protein [Candidatus Marinimicrobia bacterium]|jgi:acetyl-CoA carboxylase biotin carboxyl carrier protein|nr:acetyl-CoA carboxylase biotin carboxyl carrier protein [Candidatus Neomarinimicrobiota bacterium]|tara:strand:+ start:26887 stop:27348 length:462 start_codon:yes stop_codon:yes gene_type:complete